MKRRRVQSGRVSSGERRVRTCSAFAFPSSVWTLGHSRAGRGLGSCARGLLARPPRDRPSRAGRLHTQLTRLSPPGLLSIPGLGLGALLP